MRISGRSTTELRSLAFEPQYIQHAEGSCLVQCGNTRVLCTATVEDRPPPFLRNTGTGWVTAEYGMLPRATHQRTDREAAKGKQTGRTQEIQRLIGRALRSVVDLEALGERQIRLDCDVLQADGGTRTAAINGAYVALCLASHHLMLSQSLAKWPIINQVAAISCGILNQEVMVDLDYSEDSSAEIDANFVMMPGGGLIEVQATGERGSFHQDELARMLALAQQATHTIMHQQRQALQKYNLPWSFEI